MPDIGESKALMPESSSADEPSELLDGQSGDTNYPFGEFKALGTVGEVDPETGNALTGYPDGHAAWLLDEDTVRVAYQSESYATMSNETYPWVMESGAKFTGSHVHTIDFDRAAFADFLNNDSSASEMFEGSGHLFDTVYNVFGEVVDGENADSEDLSAKWGNQTLPDGTLIEFMEEMQLTEGDFFFHSFCGAYYEKAEKYGEGIGFEDDLWLMAEEWNIGEGMFEDPDGEDPLTGTDVANNTMGLASMVVDIDNETAYTVPALGQTGYEKLLPINSGHEDYVVIVGAGYNHDHGPAPLKIYIGKKGVDAQGNPIEENASERDQFLGRNGLLYGQLYGIAADDTTYAALGVTEVDADTEMMDEYIASADAPDSFDVRYYPTSYQWDGFDSPEAVEDTEMFLWTQDGDDGEGNEQPDGYTFFNGNTKTEHPAVDPDITKHRYVQHLTNEGGMLGIEFTDIVDELTNDTDGNGLPDYLSADATRIVPAVDGALTLETGGKGEAHPGEKNPDGTETAATHVEEGVAKMVSPDGLQWIKTADGDFLITDEDSGNDYGERKYVLPIDPETMELAEPGTGYFLAQAGGALNPRGLEQESAALDDTFLETTSSEFSGSWNVTGLVAKKEDGSFYTQEELAGIGEQEVIGNQPLSEQTLIGVVQQSGESAGVVAENKADQGGQIFMFDMENLPQAQEEDTGLEPAFGGSEGDSFTVSGSRELVFAGAGDDFIDAVDSEGGNSIYAGTGNNTVILGGGDTVNGGAGDNMFFAQTGGDNIITGGEGADQFWIATGEILDAANTIADFMAGEDVLGVAGFEAGFEDLEISDQDGSAAIAFDGNDLAYLDGIEANSLTDADFAFA